MKILVADDSKTNLAIISHALNKLGHEAIPVLNGQQAIELFQQKRPDLIILDVMMEGIDGFECAKKIRAIDNDDWIPIIFLSASIDDESIAKGIDAGGDDYLTKPFSEITLAAKIKAMQRISDMRQKLFETTQKLYLLSSTDNLTGIYNRLQFNRSIKEIVAAADRHHHSIALLFIDLDYFKTINDSFGHPIGDLLLIEVARRLKSCLRSNDFIARLGGDEFAIILSEINTSEEAGQVAQKILRILSEEYNLGDYHIHNGCSIGIALYPQSVNKENLVMNADIAMYHAKASGRNNYQYFSEDLSAKYKKQMNLENSLKFAPEKNELLLTYQPIFNLQKKHIVGVKTILSWNNPQFGLMSSHTFMPIAEETGLITQIGSWILKTACQQAIAWPLTKFKNFKFAIKISPSQLAEEIFFQQIVDILRDTQISPSQLELELAEIDIMKVASGPFKNSIKKLHDLGISIAIHDFGKGSGSLACLKYLPINTLKIEKSFIQDAVTNQNGAIIIKSLIALGKNLGLNVVAEGIETKEQLKFLESTDCPEGQGDYLGKSLDAHQITALLKDTEE